MIQVPKQNLAQVEYLLEQSVRGNHVLLDLAQLREVFEGAERRCFTLTEEDAYRTEPIIERLLEESTLEGKRAYLKSLDPCDFERVVMTYFSIVDNAIVDSGEVRH